MKAFWWFVLLCLGRTPRVVGSHADGDCAREGRCAAAPSGDPYAVLGVTRDADLESLTKAYRALARQWHPYKNGGDEKAFASIAHAYDVLKNDTKREILDRLGEEGLQRLQDGDPSVMKDWVPPLSSDEILRRAAGKNDPPEAVFQWMITSSFASLARLASGALSAFGDLRVWFGLETLAPWVQITATDASGKQLASGGTTGGTATFKFELSGRSEDFGESDVVHNCARSRFLGMKRTYYLECFHSEALLLSVRVDGGTFTVGDKPNTASSTFELHME